MIFFHDLKQNISNAMPLTTTPLPEAASFISAIKYSKLKV
jgi:hypothetical protein